jgi:hypothetical protein
MEAPAGAAGLPGEVAEFAAADGALAGAGETGPACAGVLGAEPGAVARVPVAQAVASAPTARMPAPALKILLLVLAFIALPPGFDAFTWKARLVAWIVTVGSVKGG